MTFRPLFLLVAAVALALAACDRGAPREENTAGANVTVEPPAPPPVENATAAKPPPVESAAERRRASRIGRDGPGEERAPEYEGARTSATALPSQGDDATTTDATPPPPPPAPNSTGPQS